MKARPSHDPGAVTFELTRRDDSLLDAAARTAASTAFRLRRILVPIDFSNCSKEALQYALPLAKQQGAAITLLYVVPPAYGSGEFGGIDYAQLEATMKEGAAKSLATLATEVEDEVGAQTLVRVGSPAREIVETARGLGADLIVISTHGHTGLKHVLLGSVAEHVVQRAPCPVLVVRQQANEGV